MRALLLAGLAILLPLSAVRAETDAERAARWQEISSALFGSRPVADGGNVIAVDAPTRALDAALVPVSVTLSAPAVKTLWLVVDDDPSPVVGTFHFGPAADTHALKTRVRVDQYTNLHAVIETADGKLYGTSRFIKAAGGCSAPSGTDPQEALRRLGRMKMVFRGDVSPGHPANAELLVSHPNYNGMQMDQVTRNYTPARYVKSVTVEEAGKLVFRLDSDIALSADPAITFGFQPMAGASLDATVVDSTGATFVRHFPLDQKAS